MAFLPIAAAAMMLNAVLVFGAANWMTKHESERPLTSPELERPDDIQGI